MEEINVVGIPGFREPVSCFTHLLAAPIFLVLGYWMLRKGRGNWWRTVSLCVLTFSTVFLLSMSAVYHMLGPGTARNVMRQLDIAAVFVLIAGTITPIHVILFKGFHRWAPLLLVWTAAISGLTIRAVLGDRLPFAVGNAIFLLLGWGGIISCILLWRRFGFAVVSPLLGGGIAYTLGVIVLSTRIPLVPGVIEEHELWHFAVLTGLGLHWRFVYGFAHGVPQEWQVRSARS